MDFRLATLAVALFGIDEAIFKDAGGQATDILLLCSALGQLHDLLPKFESASVWQSQSYRLQIYDELKESFYEFERQATEIQKICCNGSIEPLGPHRYDNVDRQREVPECLNSIRAGLQSHIQTLQKVIESSESRAMPSPSDRNRHTRANACNEARTPSRANIMTRLRHRDVENLVERPQQPKASLGLRRLQSFDQLSDAQPTDNKGHMIMDRDCVEGVCVICKDKQEQLDESREAIRDKEKQLTESREAIRDKEKQLTESREAIEDKEKLLDESREAIEDKEKLLAESREIVEDKEKLLAESREALEAFKQKCRGLEYERWTLEIDQFKTLKSDDDNAEILYEKLQNESKEFAEEPNQKAKLMSLHAAYVDIQIERRDYLRAEVVATSTWEECKHEDTDDSRRGYRQLCTALRQQGPQKYSDLEDLLRETWPGHGKKQQSHPLWTLENGDELCLVLELKGEFESAYALRKRLWRERKEEQRERHKDTIQSGIWASQCKLKERAVFEKGWGPTQKAMAYENAMEIVKEIWDFWDPNLPSEADVNILTAGHLLGYLHYCRRAYADASRVFEVVWKERKALFTQSPEDTMLTGHYLSQTYFQLKNYPMAKSVFKEVWNAMKFARRETSEDVVLNAYHLSINCLENRSTIGTENKSVHEGKGHLPFETLKAWFEIGWAVLLRGKYEDAACILQEVYNAYRAAPEAELHYDDIFTCGHYLSEAIAKQENGCSKATAILGKVLEEQTQYGTKTEFEVLECRYLYGCLLKEYAESQSPSPNESFQKAEGELNRVWQTRYNTNPPGLDHFRMLKAGYCLTSTLAGLRKFSDARRVLGEVWEFEGKTTEKNLLESLAFCHCLGMYLMDLEEHKTVTEQLEMATELFQRIWDISKGPPRLAGVLEDGYHLGSCRIRQLKYLQAKEVLEEVAEMIADVEFRDRGSLPIAVREALAQCKREVQVQSNREVQLRSNGEVQVESKREVPVHSTKQGQPHSKREGPVHNAREGHVYSIREGPVHSKRERDRGKERERERERQTPVESNKGQRRVEPKRRGARKGWFGIDRSPATAPETMYSSRYPG